MCYVEKIACISRKKNSKTVFGRVTKKQQAGFNLIELLICLVVITILLNSAIPSFSRSLKKNQIEITINAVNRAISLARSTAVSSGKMVTLCKSSNGSSCGGSWKQGLIIFTDQNKDRVINNDDEIVRVFPAFKLQGSFEFKAFQNKQYLQMTPLGTTNNQNGNFTFCPGNNDAALAQQLIISRNGRTRYAQDYNGDGIRENAKGEALNCD